MQIWDTLTTSALVWTALVTPFEVAMLEPPAGWDTALTDPLFIINRLIDLLFFFDMLLQFALMVQTFSDREGVKWIDEPRLIAKTYLRGWFSLDLISLIPSAFDIIPLVGSSNDAIARWRVCGPWRCLVVSGESNAISRFKALRVIRVCRLIKLTRLLRASRMLRRWETRLSINYATLSVTWSCCKYLLFSHWSACLIVLPTTFGDEPVSTWLGQMQFCLTEPTERADALSQLAGSAPIVVDDNGQCTFGRGLDARPMELLARLLDGTCTVRCAQPGDTYVGALFFALQITTGLAGFDIEPTASSTEEKAVFALIVVMGALLWGQVIGTFVSVIANSSPDLQWFRTTMDHLNRFMVVYHLPDALRVRLREYFHQTRHVQRGQQRKKLLTLMSPQLQGEVAMVINKSQLDSVRFLKGAEREFHVLFAVSLQPFIFAPGELATAGYLYMIHKGVALYGGRVLTGGKIWGQDMIMRKQSLCAFSARAMSYLEVYRISRAELLELARPFPQAWCKIRWEAFKMALARTMLNMKAAYKANGDGDTGGNAWGSFLHRATASDSVLQGNSTRDASDVAKGGFDPHATEERPSLRLLARGLERVTLDVESIKEAVEQIKSALVDTNSVRQTAPLLLPALSPG
jgi:hypothetical protein